jgi:hypothetical protein|tara:strand:- start:1196 stop:1693 length:498 start_codon:yes stop_codon:yes gene_type:complete
MENNRDELMFDAPIPGMGMTHEVGGRPWQTPPQHSTVEEALDFYIPRLTSEDFIDQLLDVIEMGVPLTTIANSLQLSSVMQGKHSVDVGILVLPVLVELLSYIAESSNVKFVSGLDKEKKIKDSTVDLAASKVDTIKENIEEAIDERLTNIAEEEPPSGLMSRRA